jgi:hypothetical protein
MGKKVLVLVAAVSALAIIVGMVLPGCGQAAEPKITSTSAVSGEAGTQLDIGGSDFGETQGTADFSGEPASILSWSDTFITVIVPSDLEPGDYRVSIKTEDGNTAQTQFEVTEEKEKEDGEEDNGGDGESEMEAVREAMYSYVEANSAPGLEFEIENIQIEGDEAAATVTSEAGPALVIMRKGESGWYGVDLGTGFEPPSWYQQ